MGKEIWLDSDGNRVLEPDQLIL